MAYNTKWIDFSWLVYVSFNLLFNILFYIRLLQQICINKFRTQYSQRYNEAYWHVAMQSGGTMEGETDYNPNISAHCSFVFRFIAFNLYILSYCVFSKWQASEHPHHYSLIDVIGNLSFVTAMIGFYYFFVRDNSRVKAKKIIIRARRFQTLSVFFSCLFIIYYTTGFENGSTTTHKSNVTQEAGFYIYGAAVILNFLDCTSGLIFSEHRHFHEEPMTYTSISPFEPHPFVSAGQQGIHTVSFSHSTHPYIVWKEKATVFCTSVRPL